jgi:hypothetical protein
MSDADRASFRGARKKAFVAETDFSRFPTFLLNAEETMDTVFLARLTPTEALEGTLQDGVNSPLSARLLIEVSKGTIRRLQARDR